jgi:DNA-binding HxlR family transcriptional regulator
VADSSAARRQRSEASAPRRPGPRSAGGRGTTGGSASLDNLIHHRIRLGIVSALAAVESLTFNEIKALLETTDGNLSVHARKLEEADYVTCTKTFDSRRPRTEYRLTPVGRRELTRYLTHMEALIRATRDTLKR